MKVLVTGCYGFVGLYVCHELLRQGHDVIGVDRVRGAISPKGERIERAGFPFVEIDLCDHRRLFDQFRALAPDAVIHIAAQYSVRYTTENLHRYIRSNLAGFCYVLEACRLAGVPRLVYASSVAVSDAGTPSGLYGATKAFNEQAAHAYTRRSGIVATGLRYGIVYGPMMRADAVTARVIRDQIDGQAGALTDQHRKRAPFVEVHDAARVTVACLREQIERHVVHDVVAYDYPNDMGDVACAAAHALGREPLLPEGYRRPTPGVRPLESTARLTAAVGMCATTTLRDGIGGTVEWMRSQND